MYYARPMLLTKAFNHIAGWFARTGLAPRKTVVLEVKGRTSGLVRPATVNLVRVDGQEYLVAPRGNTEWSRNARAAGEGTIVRGGSRRVRLEELPVEQRAPIIQAYLKENAWVTQREFGVSPKAPIEEFQRIADRHPVFRVVEL
jgi:hypothetical protein